ncbi:MAG: hypothetical protein HYX73_03790 [Acidobacteria bacterium]|nr:hypothetical protein [Acidobacteriota bacterium]
MKLSEHLQDYIEVLDRDEWKDLSTDEREKHEKDKKLVEFCVKHLIHSRETFLERPIAGLEKIFGAESAVAHKVN